MKKKQFLRFLALLLVMASGFGLAEAANLIQLQSIADIDENAEYVLGIEGTGMHKSGTSGWGILSNIESEWLKYKLVKAADGNSFKAYTTISGTTYYLQVPASKAFTMTETESDADTNLIIGTTFTANDDYGEDYAIANSSSKTYHLRFNDGNGLRAYASKTGAIAFFYKLGSSEPLSITLNDRNNESTETETSAGGGIELPTLRDLNDEWLFAGWSPASVSSATSVQNLYEGGATYRPTEAGITLYAVYKKAEGLSTTESLLQTLQYDTWTYTGTTTDKTTYRIFENGAYVESSPFDLSTLTKVIVYGGYFGDSNYTGIAIKDVEDNVWKTGNVSGKDQNKANTFTEGTSLSGTKALRVYSTSGTGGKGVRISKVEIYGYGVGYTYDSNPSITYVAVEEVTLSATTLLLTVGDTETLTATVSPSEASNKSVTWTSSDDEVATVAGGVVTAVKKGTATITVTTVDGGKTATCDVTVNMTVTYNPNNGTEDSAITDTFGPDDDVIVADNTFTKTGFSFKNWNTAADGSGTPYEVGATNLPTNANTTLYAQWTINNYSVTWKVNGNQFGETGNADYNTKPTLPTAPTCADFDGEKEFVGWTAEESWSSDSAPTDLFTTADEAPAIKADAVFNAVFAESATSNTEFEWVKQTSVPNPRGGEYVIVADGNTSYVMKASIKSSRFENGTNATIENDIMTSTPNSDEIWTIYKKDGYYRIKNGNNYAAGTTSTNQGALLTDEDADLAKWDITYDNGFIISNFGRSDSDNRYLRNNTTSGWATYAISNSTKELVLYKKSGVVTYLGYATTYTKTLSSISVNTQNAQTEYAIGENLDVRDVVVTANYSDGSTKTVTSNLTFSPADYTVLAEAGKQEVTVSYGNVSTTYEVTVNAITVTFDAGAGTCDTTSLTQETMGAAVTLPTPTIDIEGWTFAGWATEPCNTETTTAPTFVSGDYTPTEDITLYAVYTKKEGLGNGFILSLEDGGTTYYVGPKYSDTNKKFLTSPTEEESAAIFNIEEGGYLYYIVDSEKCYVKYKSGSDLEFPNDKPDSGSWDIVDNGNTISLKVSNGERYLAFNYNKGTNPRFSAYSLTSNNYPHEFTKTSLGSEYFCSNPEPEKLDPHLSFDAQTYYVAENGTLNVVHNIDANHDGTNFQYVYEEPDADNHVSVTYDEEHGVHIVSGDLAHATGHTTKVTVTVPETDTYKEATAEFYVKVVPNELELENVSGLITFSCDHALDFSTVVNGVTAYVAIDEGSDSNGSGYVVIKRISETIIPANTGLMLNVTGTDVSIPASTEAGSLEETNLFKPALAGTTIRKSDDKAKRYVYGKMGESEEAKFYLLNTDLETPSNKAYLEIPVTTVSGSAQAPVQSRRIVFNDATDLDNVFILTNDGKMYNIWGVPVGEDYHGIVIKNGRKILKKD